MANRQLGAERAERRAHRLRWLLAHPQILAGLPSATETVTDEGRARLVAVVKTMVRDGLYSSSNDHKAARWGLRCLVSEARGEGPTGGQTWRTGLHRRERWSS